MTEIALDEFDKSSREIGRKKCMEDDVMAKFVEGFRVIVCKELHTSNICTVQEGGNTVVELKFSVLLVLNFFVVIQYMCSSLSFIIHILLNK